MPASHEPVTAVGNNRPLYHTSRLTVSIVLLCSYHLYEYRPIIEIRGMIQRPRHESSLEKRRVVPRTLTSVSGTSARKGVGGDDGDLVGSKSQRQAYVGRFRVCKPTAGSKSLQNSADAI